MLRLCVAEPDAHLLAYEIVVRPVRLEQLRHFRAPLLDQTGRQTSHACGSRARPWVELRDIDDRKPIFLNKIQRMPMVLLRFCRKAADDVSCYEDAWHSSPKAV